MIMHDFLTKSEAKKSRNSRKLKHSINECSHDFHIMANDSALLHRLIKRKNILFLNTLVRNIPHPIESLNSLFGDEQYTSALLPKAADVF